MSPGPIRYLPTDSVRDEIHVQCLAYWERRRSGRRFPRRSDIDPIALKRFLPWLHMYDVWENNAFRVRLIGTEMVRLVGGDLTGSTGGPDDRDPKIYRAAEVLARVVTEGEPVLTRVEESALPGAWHKQLDTIWLPMSEDGEAIDVVLAATAAHELIDFVERE